MGLRELLEAHPELLQPSLTTLFMACARLIGDEVSECNRRVSSFDLFYPRTLVCGRHYYHSSRGSYLASQQ